MSKAHKKQHNKIDTAMNKADLPLELILGVPYLQVFGGYQVIVENFRGVQSVTGEEVRISSKTGIIRIVGKRLEVQSIANRYCKIQGIITGIDFSA